MYPEDCYWVVEEILREEDSMPRGFFVYPTDRDLELGDKEWLEAQLNRASEEGYFGFNQKDFNFTQFIDLLGRQLEIKDREYLRRTVFGAMAQVFW